MWVLISMKEKNQTILFSETIVWGRSLACEVGLEIGRKWRRFSEERGAALLV